MENSNAISTVFFGTQEFASVILAGIINDPRFVVRLVITQPDRPVGRHHELKPSPVKILAQKINLPVDDPEGLRNYELRITRLRPIGLRTGEANYELVIVAQYGLLIPKRILDLPSGGTINVHTSLLPKYRGASPIQSAIMNGENKTGITIMLMDAGMDTGPILAQEEVLIDPDDTYQTLEQKMAPRAVALLRETAPLFLSGTIKPVAQDNSLATVTKKLDRDSGRIDWNKPTNEIYNLYRGLFPWPGIWTLWNGKRIKILSARPTTTAAKPGAIVVANGCIFAGALDGSLQILQLQIEGKQEMSAAEFLNGYKNFVSAQLN
ncbi:MAG: methionyl-tRNA formyltransferase [Patescibacteria group bacterium]